MRGQLATAVRVFLGAYAGAVGWVLAGCGWGVVIGTGLEAAFGRGADGLLDTVGETSLEAVAGALLGMVGGTLLQTCLHLVTAVPLFVLLGRTSGRYPSNIRNPGIMHERSARAGALASVLCGVMFGTTLAPLAGAGMLLESIHGAPVPRAPIQWATLAGILVGGIVGLVAMCQAIYRRLPLSWQEEVRRGWRPA